MRHDFIDRYSRLPSPIHGRPAWVKMLTTLAIVVTMAVARPSWVAAFGVAGLALGTITWMSRIPPLFLVKRVATLEPFVVIVAGMALLQPNGFTTFLTLVVRSTLSLVALILFTNTTPFEEVLDLLRRLRAPSLLLTVLALMYRYIFVVVDEMERVQRARASRSYSAGTTRAWRNAAGTAGQLFVRSSERAERIYSAMCARGWQP